MAALKNKIDFVALISVTKRKRKRRPTERQPSRTDYNGMGEISDVSLSGSSGTGCRTWAMRFSYSLRTAATTAQKPE